MSAPPRARLLPAALVPALCAAFAVRAAVGLHSNWDAGIHRGFDFYGFMADHVLDGRGLFWSFYDGLGDKFANRAPLYPLFVAAVRFVAGRGSAVPVILAQAALGAAACLVPAALALRWGGRRAALVALWAAALWPYSLLHDTGLVEHVLFAPLAGLALLCTLEASETTSAARSLAAGAVASVATLARLTFAPAIPLLAAVVAARTKSWRAAALLLLGAAAAISPWLLRNHAVTGAWTLGTDSGRALWVGNAEATFHRYPAESIDEAERELSRGLTPAEWAELKARNGDEVAQDALFRGRAVAAIEARPAACAWGALRKVAALWSPVFNPGPTHAAKLAVFGISLTALLLGALAAACDVPRIRADLPACLAVAASFTAVAAVFWGQSRYLAPLHGVGIAASAAWIAMRVGRSGAPA